jgi:hypothetical protein
MDPHESIHSNDLDDGPRPSVLTSVFGRVVLGLTLALVLVSAAVAVALDVLVEADEVAGWVAPRASAALNRNVTVGDASLVLLPWPGARISEVRVDNLPGFDGPPLARTENLWVDVAILPLLFGSVRVRGLRARGLDLHLATDEDGVSNFGDLVPEPRDVRALPEGPVRWALKKLAVSEGRVTYADAREGRELTLSGASMEGRLSGDTGGGWQMRADARSDTLELRWLDSTRGPVVTAGPTARWTLHGDAVFDRVQIGEGVLAHEGRTLAVEGRVTGLRGPSPSLELTFSNDALNAAALVPWMPEGLRLALEGLGPNGAADTLALDGDVSVRLRLLAPDPLANAPVVRGDIGLQGVGLQVGANRVAERLIGSIEFEPDTLTLHGISGTVADGPFDLYGRVTGEDRTTRIEVVARPDLAALDRLGLTPGTADFSGRTALDVALTGSWLTPDDLALTGSAVLEGVRAGHGGPGIPLYAPDGVVVFEDGTMRWSDLVVIAGADRLVTTGELSGFRLPLVASRPGAEVGPDATVIDARVRGERLDMDALLSRPPQRQDATYTQVAFAHLGQRGGRPAPSAAEPARTASRPVTLPLRGVVSVTLDSLMLRPWTIDSLSAVVTLTDSTLSVTDASFGVWGGRSRASVELGIGTRTAEPFSLRLALEEVAATPFFATLTPLGNSVSGTLDLNLDLNGALDRALLPVGAELQGSGGLTVVDGRLAGTGMNHAVADFLSTDDWADVPFEVWRVDFDLRDSMFDVQWSELRGVIGDAVMSGFIALEGRIDLALGLTIPPSELGKVSLRRTGVGSEVLDRLQAAGSPLELGLRASGPIAGPTLEPDGSVVFTRTRP